MIALGLDPSGSERKRSGLAVIDESLKAESRVVKTDSEIIQAIHETNPDVVAIDSPLALPKGRCCADPSCACAVHGIVRSADRAVSRMGYRPFWTLLPSMVNLTLRSIRLRETLESSGFKVIEVYPGAAQDRLGLPRKQRGEDALLEGLYGLGIRFPDPDRKRVHDELDAVTAAYVGLCWLKDEYEAAGPPDEIQIILPLTPDSVIPAEAGIHPLR